MTSTRKRHDPPPLEPSLGDAANQVAKTALSIIPVVGTAAGDLVAAVFGTPLLRRQQVWREEIAAAIRQLEETASRTPESLSNDDAFVDTVLRATEIAMRTSQREKLDALRNAIACAGTPEAPDESLQQMFLGYVDSLTVWHLRILDLFDAPPAWFAARDRSLAPRVQIASLPDTLEQAFPELRGHSGSFCERIWADLWARGLVNTELYHGMMTPQGALQSRTTPHGKQFLRFIRGGA